MKELFGTKVEWIIHMASQLATEMRERIMSADFELVAEDPGAWFDADAMEDARERERDLDIRSNAKHGGNSAIVCTVEFGLRCTTKRPASDAAGGSPPGLERKLLMKPRVVLPSIVDLLRSNENNSSM